MCGIFGLIKRDDSPVKIQELESFNNLARHRGPDGEGCYIAQNIGLAHRRLSILDLSEAGKQPMFKNDLVIIFNGEVYNYIEIRAQLKERGYEFQSNTDTEVILMAYKVWGPNCVERFNGMWAFAIFDQTKNELFISRDRFGIKPLYYFLDPYTFAFASEIKQLLYFTPNKSANKQIVFDFLFLSLQNHTQDTFFSDIKVLQPGHNVLYDLTTHRLKIQRFYTLSIDKSIKGLSHLDAIELYRERLIDSIRLRLRSDVLVGTCLSGGLDSSLLSAIASQQYHLDSALKFKAITAQSVEADTDESYYAELVANFAKLEWHTTKPQVDEINNELDNVIMIQEEPFLSPSIIMQYFVMKKAREVGCVVLLDGQGGDETLLGYERYYTTYLKELPFFRSLKEAVSISNHSKLRLTDILLFKIYFGNSKLRSALIKSRTRYILEKNFRYFNHELLNQLVGSYRRVEDLQKNEITSVQLPKLLSYEDKNSMHFSIEARVPYLDYKLVETSISMPLESKIKNGWTKYPLRKIATGLLPEQVIWRKNKFGFEAPRKSWNAYLDNRIARIKKSEFLREIVDVASPQIKKDPEVLWKVYNLGRWAELNNINSIR